MLAAAFSGGVATLSSFRVLNSSKGEVTTSDLGVVAAYSLFGVFNSSGGEATTSLGSSKTSESPPPLTSPGSVTSKTLFVSESESDSKVSSESDPVSFSIG